MGNKWRAIVNANPSIPIIFRTTIDLSKMSQVMGNGSN
jgi:hypothetical protein